MRRPEGEAPVRLFDMHCHLDFAPDARAAADAMAAAGLGAFATTVTPTGFERASALFAGCENVRTGLGLHPWWLADGRCGEAEVEEFARLAKTTRYIGEVGLDFGKRCEGSGDAQLAAFTRIAAACADGGRLLSLHAVKAAGCVLDVLERTGALASNACVVHWFSGTSDELTRVIRSGCFVSVNPRMLETKRGRAYAQAIPEDRLLLETDMPPEGAPYDPATELARLERLVADLAGLRRADPPALAAHIADTSARLLQFP